MKTFIVLSESPLRVRKITVILILLLVLELRFEKLLGKWYKKCAVNKM